MRRDIVSEKKGEWEGNVTHIDQDRGFGFVACDEFPKGLFFHAKDIRVGEIGDLEKGSAVIFRSVVDTTKGMGASQIEVVSK